MNGLKIKDKVRFNPLGCPIPNSRFFTPKKAYFPRLSVDEG